jgi:hypothetical protein
MKKITGIELLIIAIVHSESDFIELHKRDEEMISKAQMHHLSVPQLW